jgi:hypothetical protein
MSGPQESWPWSVLGLPGKSAEGDIRRAYAARLKAIDQSSDIEGFTALRTAYDFALRIARSTKGAAKPPAPLEPLDPVVVVPVPVAEQAPPPVSLPEPLQIVVPAPPLTETEPVPAPPPPHEPTKWERFEALKSELRAGNPWSTTSHAVTTWLNAPLAKDPDVGPLVRRAIRDLIVEQVSKNGGEWPATLGKAEVRALDQAYHWLSDFRAAEADFPGRGDILYMMAEAAELGHHVNPEADAARRRRGRIERRGRYIVPILTFIALIWITTLVFLGIADLRGRSVSNEAFAGTMYIATIIAFPLTWVSAKRVRSYVVRLTIPIFDRLDRLRIQLQHFALPPKLRTNVMIAWLVALGGMSRFIADTPDPSIKWLAGFVLMAGLTHELVQVWLNSGRR